MHCILVYDVKDSEVYSFPSLTLCIISGDEEAYTLFGPLFNAVIEDYHSPYKLSKGHTSDMNPEKVNAPDLDPANVYIRSTRIRVARNLKGYALTPGLGKDARVELEKKIVKVLTSLTGDLAGMG